MATSQHVPKLLCCWMYFRNHKIVFLITERLLIPFLTKTTTRLCCVVNIKFDADDLTTQVSGASVAMVMTHFSWNFYCFSTRRVVPSHFLNQCWLNANWTLGNKVQWNFNQITSIFIQKNSCENTVCETASTLSRPQCILIEIVRF